MLRLNNSKIIDALLCDVMDDIDGVLCMTEGRVALSLVFSGEHGDRAVNVVVDRYSRVIETDFVNPEKFTADNFRILGGIIEKIRRNQLAYGN